MVSTHILGTLQMTWLLAVDGSQPLLNRLDPPTRAKVLAALAALVILGLAMMLLTWLGGRATRRYMNQYSPPPRSESSTFKEDDWATKRLVPDNQPPDET